MENSLDICVTIENQKKINFFVLIRIYLIEVSTNNITEMTKANQIFMGKANLV